MFRIAQKTKRGLRIGLNAYSNEEEAIKRMNEMKMVGIKNLVVVKL